MRDAIPDPNIITAVLKACRNQNDFALAVRFLETAQVRSVLCTNPMELCSRIQIKRRQIPLRSKGLSFALGYCHHSEHIILAMSLIITVLIF